MIKIENVVFPSAEQYKFVIQGMRNPLNSWKYEDSEVDENGNFHWGEHDLGLGTRLSLNTPDHRKFLRMLPVYIRITAPLYWWKEFDTYKIGTVCNSCSTMHRIMQKEFEIDDFSTDHLSLESYDILAKEIRHLNYERDEYLEAGKAFEKMPTEDERRTCIEHQKNCWWQIIQTLPSSYNQTRNVMLNYEVLKTIYRARRNHKLTEWNDFCDWIKTVPQFVDFIREF